MRSVRLMSWPPLHHCPTSPFQEVLGYLSVCWQCNLSLQRFPGWCPPCRQAHRSTWDHSHPPVSPCQSAFWGKASYKMQCECGTSHLLIITAKAADNPFQGYSFVPSHIFHKMEKKIQYILLGKENVNSPSRLYLPSISTTFSVSSSKRHFIS